ncbi:acyl carrier protein [Actinokineospora sp. 24-640]
MDTLAARAAALPPDALGELIAAAVRGHAAAVLPAPSPDDVPMDTPLSDVGFDSLNAVELSNLLSADTGLALHATVVFDHPTLSALAEHIRTRLAAVDLMSLVDRLAAGLAAAEARPRADAVARLRELLAEHDTGTACQGPAPQVDAALIGSPLIDPALIESASDEDIFAIIDKT